MSLDCGRSVKVGRRNVLVERLLGSGAFEVVFRVKDTSDGRVFALKDVECRSDSQIEKVVREVNALIAAKHQHIIEIMGVDTYKPAQNTHFLILTEFCCGGDLNKRLDRGSSHELNMKWVHQLADAVNYLHSRQPPIVHRDLKADNVFYCCDSVEILLRFCLQSVGRVLSRLLIISQHFTVTTSKFQEIASKNYILL